MRIRRIAIILIYIVIVLTVGVNLWITSPSSTPEIAIKKYVFSKGSIIEGFNLEIRAKDYEDPNYGWQYWVEGYYDEPGPVQIPIFYVKKNDKGWYVTSAGTGP